MDLEERLKKRRSADEDEAKIKTSPKRHTSDQEALNDIVKESEKKGISHSDANSLLKWSKEYNYPCRDDRGKPPHWIGGEHIHIGTKHVPITE